MTTDISIRDRLVPGDLGALIALHGRVYAQEYGFDVSFEAEVAGMFSQYFDPPPTGRECIWVASRANTVVGGIGIVEHSAEEARLRWLIVDSSCRGTGLGSMLMKHAIDFARSKSFKSIFLTTGEKHTDAARLYDRYGFRKTDEWKHQVWGVELVEQRYDLQLCSAQGDT